MTRFGRRVVVALAVLLGAGAGAAITLIGGAPAPRAAAEVEPTGSTATSAPASTTTAPSTEEETLLVWTSGGLPSGLAERVRSLPEVGRVTLVRGDEARLIGSTDATRVAVDVVPPGWQIPLDTLAVDPITFAPFLPPPAADAVRGLDPGEALLTEGSAALRALGTGATLQLSTGTVTVVGVVDDRSGAGAELLVSAADAGRLGVSTERYLLVGHRHPRDEVQRAIADLLEGRAARFRTPAETTWLRHGDAVEPPLVVKRTFGEFSFRDGQGRDVEIDPAWVARWIVTERVPILGSVTCHRDAIPPLRAAMADIEAANLAYLIDPADFAGCFSARRIQAGQPLSHHAWGVALDLNVDGNPRGSFSTQDQRLIDAMRRHGWTWGGTWLVPDPAHYEAPMTPTAAAAEVS